MAADFSSRQNRTGGKMRILRIMAFVVSAFWLLSILLAANYCRLHGCSGSSGNNIDGFLPAFALAPVGAPSVIWSIVVLLRAVRPRKGK